MWGSRMMAPLLLWACWPAGLDLTPGDPPAGQSGQEGDLGGDLTGGDGSDGGTDGSDGSGTGGGEDGGDDGGGGTVPLPSGELSPARQLARVSIALRGVPPTAEEFAAIESDPTLLASFVDGYLYDPAFLETMKDAYAERLLLRQDQVIQLSDDGAMSAYSESEAFTMFESPLQLIAHVIDDDRPFTEIVTTRDLWVNKPMSEAVGGEWHGGGDEWQLSEGGWGDGRPEAGLLSNSILWIRHQSVGSNDQRGRANVVADALLCEAFTDRDVDIDGTIDLGSEEAILDAVFSNENCLACHQALEPLASNFWGYQKAYNAIGISVAFQTGCDTMGDNCYPLNEYKSEDVDVWYYKDLRAPGYFGAEVTGGLAELGNNIAQDPRFAQCVVRTVYGYVAQMDRSAVPLETVAAYQKLFEDSGFNVRTLAKAIVLSPEFLLDGNGSDGTVGLLNMRPEAIGRTVSALTGFVWRAGYDDEDCRAFGCYGTVDLMNNDNFGFRTMMGGVDGMYVTAPVWDTTPTRLFALDALASEAAAWVVANDLQEDDPSQRTLLTELEDPLLTADVQAQLADLHFRFYGQRVDADDAELAPILALMNEARSSHDATELWTLAVAAMLQDPELLFY
jgi:hypothetical protein